MPVKIRSYACDYRCGYVRTKRSMVVEHEKRCFSNPLVRACRTCALCEREEQEFVEYYCDHYEWPIGAETDDDHMKFKFNCEHWKGI